ncbi:cytochrome C peroxidase [Rhodovibrio salinarum]|uniref:Cytochrome C peroxidase n=1 Tax=Rhodovibrio salinarum TaxID=1087 RepID=A0A934QMH5_9PROT|nr:cytochrome C peroxidase [Rhodovibrio salinarum]
MMSGHPVAAQDGDMAEIDDAQLIERANDLFDPIPTEPPELDGNKVTPERVQLGRMLFFDPRLSASHAISCNSCHQMGLGGDDNQPTSIGHGWQRGPRNAPTVFNAVFNTAQFWDGRAEDLEQQAKGPVQAGVEMANTPARAVKTLKSMPGYVEAFGAAFPEEEDPVTFDNMAKALEAFQATLLTPNSPFDRYLKGETDALTAKQKQGLQEFMSTGCVGCHNGVNIGGQGYYPFGLIEKPGADVLPRDDRGRFQVTKTASDEYVFRAAPLRNIAITQPYFHSGKVWSLENAVALMGVSQLGQELSEDEIDRIVAFLQSVTGEQPRVEYPVLPESTSETPLPVEYEQEPSKR